MPVYKNVACMEKLPMIAIDDKLIARVYKVDCQSERITN